MEFELGLGGSRVMRRIWVRATVVAGDMGNVAEVAEDGVFLKSKIKLICFIIDL